MRLLIVTGIFPPDSGGPASFVPRLALALKSSEFETQVVTFSDVPAQPDDALFNVVRINRRQPRLPRTLDHVAALIRCGRGADVWLVQSLALITATVAALLRRPAVHKIVGDGAFEVATNRGWFTGTLDEFQTAPQNWRFRLLRFWMRAPLQMATAVVTPSQYLADIVAGWGVDRAKIRVIHNATDRKAPAARPARPQGRPYTILTVCRLVKWKGMDGVIGALADLPDCRLVAVGGGPEAEPLKALAIQAGVADRIDWVGETSQAEVRRRLQEADVFVLNSTYEGLPHIVLEAYDEGCPVIATAAGGTPEVVQDEVTGLLIPPGRPDALAAAVHRVAADPAMAERHVSAGRRLLEQGFDRDRMIDAYRDVLRAAAKREVT